MKIKFSILIPAYKVQYLECAIESCLNQIYNNFELIIVDDCSPHDIKSVVDKFDDERIHYYRNVSNCGALNVVDNWNIALSYATGDFAICMGDDDMLMPHALDLYNEAIRKYPLVNAFHARSWLIDSEGKKISITRDRPEYQNVYSLLLTRFGACVQFIGDFCYRVSSLKENGGYYKLPMAWSSDDITALILSCDGMVNINEPTFMYRINPQTITSSGNGLVKMDAVFQECMWYKSFFENLSPKDEEEIFMKKLVEDRLDNFLTKRKSQTLSSLFKEDKKSIFTSLFWNREKRPITVIEYLYSIYLLFK